MKARRTGAALAAGMLCWLSSCAIYLDKPEKRLFQGRVRHADGRPAAGAKVTVASPRKYFPLLLMLVPHQPLRLMTGTETDEEGKFRIEAEVTAERVMVVAGMGSDEKGTPSLWGRSEAEAVAAWHEITLRTREEAERQGGL
jgi:hypothetical protein